MTDYSKQPTAAEVQAFIARNVGKLDENQMARQLNVPLFVIKQFLPRSTR